MASGVASCSATAQAPAEEVLLTPDGAYRINSSELG
tara:strand:+ start:541 stop:648 length:108 start_codon:yes stop_codon:yes gene_type:complete